MHDLSNKFASALKLVLALAAFSLPSLGAAQIATFIDASGDGQGNTLDGPRDIAIDSAGNLYVTGEESDNAFKISTTGVITEIIDATGDGAGNVLDRPWGIAVDDAGDVYVVGRDSHNAFRITPGGTVTQIVDATGDGAGNTLSGPRGIAVDGSGNAFVTSVGGASVLKITPAGIVTKIIDATGAGAGTFLSTPEAITVDAAGTVYVAGWHSNNVFTITPAGVITQFAAGFGVGTGGFDKPSSLAIGETGNLYIAGWGRGGATQISPSGVATGLVYGVDDKGNILSRPYGIAVDRLGNVLLAGSTTHNAFRITTSGAAIQIIDSSGDGLGSVLTTASGIVVGPRGEAYVLGLDSDNGFVVMPPAEYRELCNGDGGDQLGCTNCPCSNNAAVGTAGGCLNSAGQSAHLIVTGQTSASLPSGSNADLRFAIEGAPAGAFCILNSGDFAAPSNPTSPCIGQESGIQATQFDGLRCAIVNTRRHGGRSADLNGDIGFTNDPWGGEGGPTAGIAKAGAGFVSGQTRYFQVINRDDPLASCMRGLNTSQAVEIMFTP